MHLYPPLTAVRGVAAVEAPATSNSLTFGPCVAILDYSLEFHYGASNSRRIGIAALGPQIKYAQADQRLFEQALPPKLNTGQHAPSYQHQHRIHLFRHCSFHQTALNLHSAFACISVLCYLLPWHRPRNGRETRSQMPSHRRCSLPIIAQLGSSRMHLFPCPILRHADIVASLGLMSPRSKSSAKTNPSRSTRTSSSSTQNTLNHA